MGGCVGGVGFVVGGCMGCAGDMSVWVVWVYGLCVCVYVSVCVWVYVCGWVYVCEWVYEWCGCMWVT